MDESEPLLPKRSETSNRRAIPHIVNIELKYDSIEQVTVQLPVTKTKTNASPDPDSETDTSDDSTSVSSSDTDTSSSDPKTINIDEHEPAPSSYVCLGYTFSIIAGFCFTSCNVGIKVAGIHIAVSSWQMLLVRCTGQCLIMLPIIWWTRSPILATPDFSTRWRLVAQALIGGLMLLSIFEAVEKLPLGDCTAIFFATPAVTLLLSVVLLKDHCGMYRFLLGTSLLCGVVIISRPPALFPVNDNDTKNATNKNETSDRKLVTGSHHVKEAYDLVGLGFALAVPFLSGWVSIITRELRHIHFSVLVFWFAVGGLVISSIGILCLDTTPLFHKWTYVTWLLSLQQAVLGIVGSILMTKAVCWVSPAKSMVIRSFQVIISYVVQVEFFGTLPHLSDYFGAFLIMTAVLTIGAEDKMMKTFSHWKYC